MKTGKFTGVGVGPGDPGLVTIGALKGIEACDVLVLPAADRDSCRGNRLPTALMRSARSGDILRLSL